MSAEHRRAEAEAEVRRWNLIHFHSDPTLNQLYAGRVEKYLQPDLVGWSFHADDAHAFNEITLRQEVRWDLLVVDLARLQTHAGQIRDFQARHPDCKILLLGDTFSNAIISLLPQSDPRELDDWLTMMRSLIG